MDAAPALRLYGSYLFGACRVALVGLLYTKLYLDFGDAEWEQVASDPVVFRARTDGVVLDIEDTSHKSYRLVFGAGGRVGVLRVSGKFRIPGDDDDDGVSLQ